MVNDKKQLVFKISRNDYLYNFASDFEDVFKFSMFKNEKPSNETGVRLQENFGYDFQSECTPIVEITPFKDNLIDLLHGDIGDYCVNIAIDDTALKIRSIEYVIPLGEISRVTNYPLRIKKNKELCFSQGFEVRCFITRRLDLEDKDHIIWSKSQVIHESSFQAKVSGDDAWFLINWIKFKDDDSKKDVLYYINWKSSDVSTLVSTDCFEVIANDDHKTQFRRLENNKVFGVFCIKQIAEQILKELIFFCLRNADMDLQPEVDSLHDKVKSLFNDKSLSFDDFAKQAQSEEPLDHMIVSTRVSEFIQQYAQIGSTLEDIKFGGFRGS